MPRPFLIFCNIRELACIYRAVLHANFFSY